MITNEKIKVKNNEFVCKGETWIVEKNEQKKIWYIKHKNTNSVVCKETTKRYALLFGQARLKEMSVKEVKAAILHAKKNMKKKKYWNDTRIKNLFEKTFKTSLFRFRDCFMFAVAGIYSFDVIRFDKYLHVPDGTSTNEYIKNIYGNYAVKLCKRLI